MNTSALPRRNWAWGELAGALATWRPVMGLNALILGASLYFAIFTNTLFWRSAVSEPVEPTWVLSLFLLIVAIHGIWLSALMWRRTARLVLTVLVITCVLASHYMSSYGIYIDADMVRNVLHTDPREVRELIGSDLVRPLLMSMPALLVIWRIQLREQPWRRTILARMALVLGFTLLGVAGTLVSLQPLTSFVRNHREIRYLVTPANILVSITKLATESPPSRARAQLPIGEDAKQSPAATMRRPRVLLLVVGETARAANWGLNGYERQTTPELARRKGVVNFPHVTACGSSTEVSLPCMFSPWGRDDYDEKAIRRHQSVLHVLARAGVATLWRDNQSGCKGVCAGLHMEEMRLAAGPERCSNERCPDELLLAGLQDAVGRHRGDQVIVLHMLGNHGPNYFQRYPPEFRRFAPACETSDLGRCSRQEIVNAYDNALLYTDYVLAAAIRELDAISDYDTALLYVSDHGESLGENGLYLHGMPYAIAPKEQLQVPMIAWLSDRWRHSTGMDADCLTHLGEDSYSHDDLFHTVLGMNDITTSLYRPERDIFRPCRTSLHSSLL